MGGIMYRRCVCFLPQLTILLFATKKILCSLAFSQDFPHASFYDEIRILLAMRFVICIDPMTRFLFQKFLPQIPPNIASASAVNLFLNKQVIEPRDFGPFIDALSAVEAKLVETDQFYKIIVFRKYVGVQGVLRGMLNVLQEQGHEVFIVAADASYQQKLQELISPKGPLDDVRAIASLNMDENEEFNNFILKTYKIPVNPLTFSIFLSKWVKNFTFAPHAPRAFYLPEGTRSADYIGRIQALARENGIEYLFLKDEFGFNSGAAVPYYIAPINTLEKYCNLFYEKSRGVTNLGGLLLEEFLARDNTIDIYKSHYFGAIIPREYIHYHVDLNAYQDGAPYEKIIGRMSEEPADVPQKVIDIMNPVIARFYPYCFASVDCIVPDGNPRIIDLNSMAGSLGYVQQLRQSDDGNPFQFFNNHVVAAQNLTLYSQQIAYRTRILALYDKIRAIGPSFIAGKRVISLKDHSEQAVADFLT